LTCRPANRLVRQGEAAVGIYCITCVLDPVREFLTETYEEPAKQAKPCAFEAISLEYVHAA